MKLLLFDVDQTLINTGGAGIRALNRAFRKILAFDDAMSGVLPHGKTDPAIIREICMAVGDDRILTSMDSILEAYLLYLREEVSASTSYCVLPGISSVLQQLSTRSDVLLGLATGNIELGARIKLERGDLNRYFGFGGFGSDCEDRTGLVRRAAELAAARCAAPLDACSTFVIGDTPRDIEAGRAAGFCTIGVATGHYNKADLEQAGATCVISDFERERDQFLRVTRMA